MSVNKVILIGRVGKPPEVKNFDNGGKIVNFSLATDESYKDKQGQKVEATEWHNVSISGKLVDVVEKYVKQGDMLYLEGKNKTRSWDDKEGNKKYTTEVICFQMTMLGGKKQEGQQASPQQQSAPDTSNEDDELPF
jgi:single-strand DNA-binding protein